MGYRIHYERYTDLNGHTYNKKKLIIITYYNNNNNIFYCFFWGKLYTSRFKILFDVYRMRLMFKTRTLLSNP